MITPHGRLGRMRKSFEKDRSVLAEDKVVSMVERIALEPEFVNYPDKHASILGLVF
jgi:hypothetical protein